MVLSYSEVSAIGDVLPNNRHELSFPNISGVLEDGEALKLRHTTVTLPPFQVGQIIVKQLGWSLAFAGIRTQQNTFSCEFVETINAPVIKLLSKWQDSCAGFKTHMAKMKADSAAKAQCIAYDTAGKSALVIDMYNVWPMSITYGQFSEESSAAHVNVEFSVDCIDIVDVVYEENDFQRSVSTSANEPSLSYNSRSGSTFSSGAIGSFNIYNNVLTALKATTSNAASLLSRYI